MANERDANDRSGERERLSAVSAMLISANSRLSSHRSEIHGHGTIEAYSTLCSTEYRVQPSGVCPNARGHQMTPKCSCTMSFSVLSETGQPKCIPNTCTRAMNVLSPQLLSPPILKRCWLSISWNRVEGYAGTSLRAWGSWVFC